MTKPSLTFPCKFKTTDFQLKNGTYYCQSCSQTIHDFRNTEKEEILNTLSSGNNQTCGIFRIDQVTTQTVQIQLGVQRMISLSLLGILGFMGTAVLSSCDAEAVPEKPIRETAFSKLKFPLVINGTIIDSSNSTVLPNTQVSLLQQGRFIKRVTTNENGVFRMELMQGELKNNDFELHVYQSDYQLNTVPFDEKTISAKQLHNLTIALQIIPDPESVNTSPDNPEIVPVVAGNIAPAESPFNQTFTTTDHNYFEQKED